METETNRPKANRHCGEWCKECRSYQYVIDQHEESVYERSGEYGFKVTDLDCGHWIEHGNVRLGDSPGAPSVAGAFPNMTAVWNAGFR
jgi:hypothetical protein